LPRVTYTTDESDREDLVSFSHKHGIANIILLASYPKGSLSIAKNRLCEVPINVLETPIDSNVFKIYAKASTGETNVMGVKLESIKISSA
jgi:hypothetical protein